MEPRFRDLLSAVGDDEIVALETRLVAIPSYTTEEAELAECIADYLNDQGVEVGLQRVPFPGNRKSARTKSYNVIGRIRGDGSGPSLMFNGHMDHGPLEGRRGEDLSRWARAPFQPVVEGGFLYGKGCQDEKGGLCAMLVAIVAIRRVGLRLCGDLMVTPVCGHKTHSAGTRHLVDSGLRADMAINTENSGNAIVPCHVGVLTATIDLEGDHPHPTPRRRFPGAAWQPSPFERVRRVLDALGPESAPYRAGGWLRFVPHPAFPDFPWHHVDDVESHGFTRKTIHLWYHTPPGVTAESLKEDLERLLAGLADGDPGFQARVETRAFGPAMETRFDAPVVQTLARWHQEVSGEPPVIGAEPRYGLYGDGSVLSQAGITSVVYGPGGGLTDLDHQWRVLQGLEPPDERIPVRDLVVAARVCTLVAADICG